MILKLFNHSISPTEAIQCKSMYEKTLNSRYVKIWKTHFKAMSWHLLRETELHQHA